MNEKIKWIELDKIKPHPKNPRLELNEDMISNIQHGIQQEEGFHESRHITVIENKEDYVIIDGHHRYEAAKREGLESIPCWIRDDIDNEFILMDIENNQNPFSRLVRGRNINFSIQRSKIGAGRGNKGGIMKYAQETHISESEARRISNAAIVFDTIEKNSPSGRIFNDKAAHLYEIYKLPKECWDNAVGIMLKKDWTVTDTQQQIKKTKEGVTKKQIIALLSGKISPNKLKQIYNIKEILINYLENNKDEDEDNKDEGNKELVDELIEQWNNYFKIEDPLNIDNVRTKREQIESQFETGNKLKYIDFRFGDFEKVFSDIPNASIDAIITDPPYPYENIEEWGKLAKFAKRVLKPGKFCIAYSGQTNLPEVIKRMEEHLNYYWIFCLEQTGQNQLVHSRNLFCNWKPILVFQNEFKLIETQMDDIIKGTGREKSEHPWQQAKNELRPLIENFTNIGETIIDPFAGSGTTIFAASELSRYVKAAEIDEDEFYKTNEKIQNQNDR